MYTNLIAAVLTGFAQYGPGLVKSVVDLIHGNPQRQNETDGAYVDRINALIDSKAADTTAADQGVIGGIQTQTVTAAATTANGTMTVTTKGNTFNVS